MSEETKGLWLGFLGVASFSLTLPVTRSAVAHLDPLVVGLGRSVAAALLAGALLRLTRQPVPERRHLGRLVVIVLGVIIGFPFLSAWAMARVPASHGAIVLGLLPLATAAWGALRAGERPSGGFWAAGVAGSATVIIFALRDGAGGLHAADLALLGAVLAAAIGYAEGAILTRELGGWQVISWALVLAAPFLLVPVGIVAYRTGLQAPPSAWIAFAYVAVVSQFFGFFAWYRGLALGGVARVSQMQLLQPFLTIMAAAVIGSERVTLTTIAAAAVVVLCVFLGRRARVERTQ